jgi:hypothetical protein
MAAAFTSPARPIRRLIGYARVSTEDQGPVPAEGGMTP